MKKILITEDDKFLANAYRLKLSKEGFETRVASDGREALEALKEYTPDLILLDLVMPVMDGFTTLEEIHKHPEWSKIPIIVASNLGQKEDMDRATSLGAKGYIVKADMPMSEIIEKIKKLV